VSVILLQALQKVNLQDSVYDDIADNNVNMMFFNPVPFLSATKFTIQSNNSEWEGGVGGGRGSRSLLNTEPRELRFLVFFPAFLTHDIRL
jgi:hypothetical protein